jgi:L-aspartate oxidase
MPRPLLSEALRGHGALLRDAKGEQFVDELAPRDVVSRAMADRMAAQGVGYMWLDATGLESFGERFPTVAASLAAAGLDPAVDWLPIAPAAHYLSGGIVTDLDGASAMPGLWAVGEVACTGVHGANRLASNSLLEGMVFGARLAEAITSGRDGPEDTGVMRVLSGRPGAAVAGGIACIDVDSGIDSGVDTGIDTGVDNGDGPVETPHRRTRPTRRTDTETALDTDVAKLRERLQRAMIEGAGVLRSPESLRLAAAEVGAVARQLVPFAAPASHAEVGAGRAAGELANLVTVAGALLRAACVREETRGAHARRDFPEARPQWRCRLVHRAVATPGSLPPHPRPQS